MRLLLALAVSTIACSNNPEARSCLVERDARPKVSFAWRVAHGSLDDEPPRAALIELGVPERLLRIGVPSDVGAWRELARSLL